MGWSSEQPAPGTETGAVRTPGRMERRLSGMGRQIEDTARWAARAIEPPGEEWWPEPSFPAKITGSTAVPKGTSPETYCDNRYQYAWTEQQRTATGWQDLSGGRSGTTSSGFALNGDEANNPDDTATPRVMGNSIDHADAEYPATNWLQPVRGNPVVRMFVDVDDTGAVAYSFQYENAEQGACD
jgi:hypothetical protein